MTFAFLPSYFKKIGIACFIASIVIIFAVTIFAVMDAFSFYNQEREPISSFMLGYEMGLELSQKNKWVTQIGSALLMLSISFYMLAKEKVDDEYMDAIRWESLRLSIIVSITITIVCIILSWKLPAKTILFIQFTTYLITFKIKKSGK